MHCIALTCNLKQYQQSNLITLTCDAECAGNPCRNEGLCIAVTYMPLGYSCICRAMFRGTHCELDFFGKLTDNSG